MIITNAVSRRSRNPGIVDPGVVSPFIPSDIAGLKLWLDADYAAFTDAGITPAVNNDPVQQWNDRSLTGNVSQAVVGNRPTLKTNIIGSHSVLRFDGADDSFDLSFPLIGGQQSFFMVLKVTSGTSAVITNTGGNGSRYIFVTTSTVRYAHFDPNFADSGVGTLTNFNILTCIQNGPAATAYVNGVPGTTNNGQSSSDNNGGYLPLNTIGNYPNPGLKMKGDIAQILYYDTLLTTPNQLTIQAYLNGIYNIY